MDKIWVEIAKNFEMRTSGGRGGSQRIRTPPDEGGRGGQKRANFCGRPLWMAPLGDFSFSSSRCTKRQVMRVEKFYVAKPQLLYIIEKI